MDRDTFFRHLRRSRLLSEQEIDAAARLTEGERAKVIANALVERGLLTRYQAGRILAGRPGRLVLGQYRLLDELGRGATGRVFKAVHTVMGRVVAVKVILPALLKDASARELFDREVRAAARLHHSNIVAAYDANDVRGVCFLVMEYVHGPSLQELVKAEGPLPLDLACALMRQAADALRYAHERGMVHRDIKPANLLVIRPASPSGEEPDHGGWSNPVATPVVKLVDFGLARVYAAGKGGVGTITAEPGAVLGTVDYISPEQAHDVHSADIRSDLYSLGCTFYYALTGQVPFPGGNAMEKLLKQLMNEPQPLRELRPEVPAAVEAVVLRLMAKNPNQRFQTPAELAHALGLLSGEGAETTPATQPGAGAPQTQPVPEPPAERAGGSPGPAGSTGGGVPALDLRPERPADRPGGGGSPLPSGALLSLGDLAFREKFRQWTALVEFTLRRRGALRGLKRQAFSALQQDLVKACRAQAEAAEGARREFYQRLEERLKPWLNPDALAHADLEIHYQVAHEFREAEEELDRWVAGGAVAAEGDRTGIGRLLKRFKKARDETDFKERMRELYGIRL
jgi:serine/threonine protein kinase